MEWLSDPQAWIAFLTLVALEIVLGIVEMLNLRLRRKSSPVNLHERYVPDAEG